MDIYPSGHLDKIILTIWDVNWCGGYDVYVRINQGENSPNRCRTTTKKSFKPGDILTWEGEDIKGCKKINFNVNSNKIRYKLKSKSKNKFCPEYLQVWFNNTYFRSDKMSFWVNKYGRSFSKNVALFAARKVPIQVTKKIMYGKFYWFLVDSYSLSKTSHILQSMTEAIFLTLGQSSCFKKLGLWLKA